MQGKAPIKTPEKLAARWYEKALPTIGRVLRVSWTYWQKFETVVSPVQQAAVDQREAVSYRPSVSWAALSCGCTFSTPERITLRELNKGCG